MALDHGTCANGPGWTNSTYATKQGFHAERAFSVNSFKPVNSNRNTLVKHKETPIEQQSFRPFGQPRIGLLSESRPTIYMDRGVSKISFNELLKEVKASE